MKGLLLSIYHQTTAQVHSKSYCARCQCAIVFFRLSLSFFSFTVGSVCLSTMLLLCTTSLRIKGLLPLRDVRKARGAAGARRRPSWLVALLLTHLSYNDGSQEIQQLSKAHLNSCTSAMYLLVENTTYLTHLYSNSQTTIVPFRRNKPKRCLFL